MLIQSSYRSLWVNHPLKLLVKGPRKCWAAKSSEQKWKENNSSTQIKTQTSRTAAATHTSTPMRDGTEAALRLSLEREVMVSETAQRSPLQTLTGLRRGERLFKTVRFIWICDSWEIARCDSLKTRNSEGTITMACLQGSKDVLWNLFEIRL